MQALKRFFIDFHEHSWFFMKMTEFIRIFPWVFVFVFEGFPCMLLSVASSARLRKVEALIRQFSTWKFRDSDVEIATEMIHGNYRNINDVLTRFLIVFEVQRNLSSRNFNSNNDIHWQSVWLYQLLSCNSI